jgi:hypothetical protein
MRMITSLRVLTWCCVVLLVVLSLLPAHDMVRTSLPGRVEHVIAYAGMAAIAMAGYGATRGAAQIISGFWVESGCGAVAVGRACLLPPLSSGGALVARP